MQFIDKNFEFNKVVLQVHVILWDNPRNMEKAIKDADFPSLPCMSHKIQLVMSEGGSSQRSITYIIAAGRRNIGHYQHSQLA